MNCSLIRTSANEVICTRCQRKLPLPDRIPLERIQRACLDDSLESVVYGIFVDTAALGYKPWVLYTFTSSQLEQLKVQPEILLDDGSRVGTAFKAYTTTVQALAWWADFKQCRCLNLQYLLDAAPIPFLEQHEKKLCYLIQRSAQAAKVPVPLKLIRILLHRAIRSEYEKLRM